MKDNKIIENRYTSWDTLTLSLLSEIGEIGKDDTNPVEQQTEILSILTGADTDELMALPLSEYSKLAKTIQYLYQLPVPKPLCPTRIEVNGHRYKVVRDAREWTAAQYIDFQTYLQRGSGLDNVPNLLSVALLPYNREYNEGYDMAQVIKDIGDLPVRTVMDMSAFFLRRSEDSLRAMAICLALEARRTERKMKKRN